MHKEEFLRFWHKYRNHIIGGLFFLFIINTCSQLAVSPEPQVNKQQQSVGEESVGEADDDESLKSFEELMREQQNKQRNRPVSFFETLLLLTLGFGIVWLFQQKWWKARWKLWFPGRVHFKVSKKKDRVTGRQLLKISIENHSNVGLTFLDTMVVFRKWQKERRFRFKVGKHDEVFPITLAPDTSHRVVLDLEQFFEKIPDLKGANRVGASVETTDDKQYRDFTMPMWLDWLFK